MSMIIATIYEARKPGKIIYLTKDLARSLNLEYTNKITLCLGSRKILTQVKWLSKSGPYLYITSSLLSQLNFPQLGSSLTLYHSGNELHIGPLIGILTEIRPVGPAIIGTHHELVQSFLKTGAGASLCFAFSPHDVNWSQETVSGSFLIEDGSWVRRTVPLPDVVYNRLPSRRTEKLAAIKALKQNFISKDIPLFNWAYFDKSEIYKLLEGTDVAQYVPESYTDPSSVQIKSMLKKYSFLYLKPTGGSLGIGIYRITFNPSRGYYARFRQGGQNVLLHFRDFESLMQYLRSKNGGLVRYIAQQGISLIEMDGCPIDFRIHLNKNKEDKWIVAGFGAKKAGKGSVTTHVRTGGRLLTPERVFREQYGSSADSMLAQVKETAILLADSIQSKSGYLLGELGLDIGMDKNSKIWMFEANSKPGRSIYKHPMLASQGKVTMQHLHDYCLYLSEFRPDHNHQLIEGMAPEQSQAR